MTKPRPAAKERTVREVLAHPGADLTPAESKIVQLLLADYPVAGLGTASSLAKRAGVSDPTVVRLIAKLGFEHFSQFQARLLGEVEERLRSPLMMLDSKRPERSGAARGYLNSVVRSLHAAAEAAVDQPYERAADLIMKTRGRILLLGGRFSRHVAGMLAGYMRQFHPDVQLIAPLHAESIDELVDLGRGDLLIVFDYRRYQTDVIDFTRQAQAQGVRIILFSDPWMSPIAEIADIVIIASAEVDSPYDSLAPAVAQMEVLVAHIVVRDKEAMTQRIATIERLRERNAITVDGKPRPPPTSMPGKRSRS
jgi:DNA-binding MurR/RpiR family transcriptional regulator